MPHPHRIVLEKNTHTQHRSSSLDTFYAVEGIDEEVKQSRQVFPLTAERLSGLGAGCLDCSNTCTTGHGYWCLDGLFELAPCISNGHTEGKTLPRVPTAA